MARAGSALRERRAALRAAARLAAAARAVPEDHAAAVAEVGQPLRAIREELAARELAAIPVARLKDVTEGRLRLGAVESAGYATVGDVLKAGRHELRHIPGVGPQTADQALAAAGQIAGAVEETVAVRIEFADRAPRTTALVVALHRLVEAGPQARRAVGVAEALDRELAPLLAQAGPAAGRFRLWLLRRAAREQALSAADRLREVCARAKRDGVPELLAQASVDLLRAPAGEIEAWVDFEVRSAEYYSLLAELSGRGPDRAAAEGYLPSEVAERVREQPLDDSHLRVSLRGYQAFGARFALAQRRVVLGDEMGLGKTVQAVAALAHLAAGGRTHFLVVCPAGVLVNWTREIRGRSALRAVPLHGPDRHEAFAEWRARGGVGVTTYDALRGFTAPAPAPDAAAPVPATPVLVKGDGLGPGKAVPPADGGVDVAMLVVDEAHYVKNPETRRSRAVAEWAAGSERVLFLTGTPMENRVGEFRALVRHLQPDLVPEVGAADGAAGSHAFRAAVAPAYLRRNQADVLTELPTLVQTDEWQELSAADQDAYREAVAGGNFMAMRRAAFARPGTSAKLQRLRELVAEAAGSGLKVVVFSYFRDVLAAVRQALVEDAGPAAVHGPLAGGQTPAQRQAAVDAFGAVQGHAVLLAQIEAGGVGLNLQAASVVIICEPQLKPTIEHQAVARAHRMGQVRPVQVHRLLTTTGVDQRLLQILESKSRLFDAYARRSEVAAATPDAVDISEGSLARRIVEEEQLRLHAERA
ncbi:DEAD/DEAH box helicase [Streptomyces sp. NPDC020917]|uniref:DEAD/DEAH box helicase n=1 Tax=Streptomyces sp. NPDC020917 TaxID=3365102 RepID=UPI0037AA9547